LTSSIKEMLRRESLTRLYYKKIGALLISEGNVATLSKSPV
jgi:hypothetical protein